MTGFIEAGHWSEVPKSAWPWKNFTPQEMASRGDGSIRISVELMEKLSLLRSRMGAPFIINSAYRDAKHNVKVGGAKNSYHVRGMAADISMSNHDPEVFASAAREVGLGGLGFYPPKKGNFIHVDVGPKREWGTRWKAGRYDEEPRPKTAGKAAITTLVSTAGAGVAGVVDPENLKQVQETVTPWLAYAPQFQAVFMACGAGILGWMLWNRFVKRAP